MSSALPHGRSNHAAAAAAAAGNTLAKEQLTQ
jgi:hypothetical protein